MSVQENYNRTLKIRINSELLNHVKSEADKLNIDVSSKSGENRME